MSQRSIAGLAVVGLFAATLSCAVGDAPDTLPTAGYGAPPAASAARMGLHPAYRGFYDALEGEGDWVLIEPYGWLFRPAVNFDSWRPYLHGWWEPSEVYGWVWISSDPFGWLTDHYGSWFYDAHQGWVWQPGPVWGPAWVAWVGVGDYVGWAPLAPPHYDDFAGIPSGVFTFAPAQQFGSMQPSSQALFVQKPPPSSARMFEITNLGRRDGVTFNRGPGFDDLRRRGGAIPLSPDEPEFRRLKLEGVQPPAESDLLERTKRLVAAGIRDFDRARTVAPAPESGDTSSPRVETDPRAKGATPDSAGAPRALRKEPRKPLEGPRGLPERSGRRGGERDSTKG